MERNKSDEYTFGVDEKETLDKLDVVEASVEKDLLEKGNGELVSTKYYSKFVVNVNGMDVELKDVFITAEKDDKGQMSYHFRWIKENENGEKAIEERLTINSDGKILPNSDLAKYLGEELNIEEVMNENDQEKDRLKGVSKKIEPKENEKKMKKQENEKQEENDETQEIAEDLEAQGEDLELINIRKIKDPNVKQRMPEVFGEAEEHAQAYSKKLGKYVMLENKDGKWQINDKVEPAKPTMRSIISIDEQGEKIEREVPHALMKTNRDDKEIAVTYGQYGEINIETVDVLPCQERIARGVREQGETSKGEESAELRRQFETSGKEYTHNLAHQVEKIEEAQKESNQIEPNEISENNYIPNTDTTWKELMEETGESLPELVERYNKDMAASGGKEEPKNIIQRIIEDYQMVSHEHKR
jgi:hypothetical protein